MIRLLPYAAAVVVGFKWDSLPLYISLPTLLICTYLVYTDSKDET